MKRLLGFITSLVLLLTAVFPAYATENGHVIINQVYGASNDGYADHSFIELYNPTNQDTAGAQRFVRAYSQSCSSLHLSAKRWRGI